MLGPKNVSRKMALKIYSIKIAVFWDLVPCNSSTFQRCHHHVIALMMEVAVTSETSVNLYQSTPRNSPEDSHLHFRRREKLGCYQTCGFLHTNAAYINVKAV
jgi:hypothetical protein